MITLSKRQKRILIILLIAVVLFFLIQKLAESEPTTVSFGNIYYVDSADSEHLLVTMLDIGQGDAFLLECNGKLAMVDCGPPEALETILSYFDVHGIKKIDYFFGTHPHDDHLGSLSELIDNIEIETIVIPEVTVNVSPWYTDLTEKLADEDYYVEIASVGNRYFLGDTVIEIIGPLSEPSEDLNDYSIVMKVSFGEMDLLMTGDATTSVEKELLNANINLEAKILKVGHHGSKTSTSAKFLKAVNPDYALISCKVGNRYKHPTKEVMDRLFENNVTVYRTDECGTVHLIITKTDVTFCVEEGDYLSGPELEEKLNG